MDPIIELNTPRTHNLDILERAANLNASELKELMLSYAEKAYIKYYEYRFILCSSNHPQNHEQLLSYRNQFAILFQQFKQDFSEETKNQALALLNQIPEGFNPSQYTESIQTALEEHQASSSHSLNK